MSLHQLLWCRLLIPSLLVASLGLASLSDAIADEAGAALVERFREQATERWGTEIARLETLDAQESYGEDTVLLVGSSSIRLWNDAAEDLTPYAPVRRGYGGARLTDAAVFAPRLIHPHRFSAMVLFVANDVTGSENDRTPEEVAALLRYILDVVRQHEATAPVLVVEITPSRRRWEAWPQIRQANAALREVCLTEPHTYFVPTAEDYLTPEGEPREELFVDDLLHLNRDGYRLWGRLIKERLDAVLSGSKPR